MERLDWSGILSLRRCTSAICDAIEAVVPGLPAYLQLAALLEREAASSECWIDWDIIAGMVAGRLKTADLPAGSTCVFSLDQSIEDGNSEHVDWQVISMPLPNAPSSAEAQRVMFGAFSHSGQIRRKAAPKNATEAVLLACQFAFIVMHELAHVLQFKVGYCVCDVRGEQLHVVPLTHLISLLTASFWAGSPRIDQIRLPTGGPVVPGREGCIGGRQYIVRLPEAGKTPSPAPPSPTNPQPIATDSVLPEYRYHMGAFGALFSASTPS
ncbi:hypothetical protein HDU89_007814 [Geranomyces variabilis]|nr:hypothetical protein HDU89_007814 [Geranomyces variabilis]